jgi:hypothetical protein
MLQLHAAATRFMSVDNASAQLDSLIFKVNVWPALLIPNGMEHIASAQIAIQLNGALEYLTQPSRTEHAVVRLDMFL